jgi:DNA-binding CsgD family transcriptional regulator
VPEAGDKSALAWAILNLGRVAHTKRDDTLAQAYLAQGRELFEELNERRGIASVLLDMARVVHAQGDRARAQTYYVESLAELRVYIDALRIPECFEGLADLASTAGQPARAAGLLGAAEVLRDSYGLPLPPVYRASYERTVDAARAQLDEAAFAAAWAAGQAMTMEQAIAEALRVGVEAPPAQTETSDQGPQLASAAPERLGALTPRERQVLALIAHGASNRAIAEALVIAERTAEIHVSNILSKLGVTSRTQAAAFALAQGPVAQPDA